MNIGFMQFSEQLHRAGLPSLEPKQEDDRWIELLQNLKTRSEPQEALAWFTAGVLLATASFGVRNAAALALADLDARDFAPSIVEALRRPDVAKQSGTLLYALSELGAFLPIDAAVNVIENGSYEGRSMALTYFLEEGRVEQSDDAEMASARSTLAHLAAQESDPERSEAAQEALRLLSAPL